MRRGTSSTQDIAAGAVIVALAVAALVVAVEASRTAKFQTIGPDLFPRLCAYG